MRREWPEAEQNFDQQIRKFLQRADLRGPVEDLWRRPGWCAALVQQGWSAPAWPQSAGGPGWSATRQYLWYRACRDVLPEYRECASIAHAGPLIVQHGSPDQQRQWLPDILAFRQHWDVAWHPDAQQPAQLQGGTLNGRYVWLDDLSQADWLLCHAVSEDDQAPVWLALPLDQPGVEITLQTTLAGDPMAAVQLRNVAVPTDAVLRGDELDSSRLLQLQAGQKLCRSGFSRGQLRLLESQLAQLTDSADLQRRKVELQQELTGIEALELRYVDALQRGVKVPFHPALLDLKVAQIETKIGALLMDSFGYYALPFPSPALTHNEPGIGPEGADRATYHWLRSTVEQNYLQLAGDL